LPTSTTLPPSDRSTLLRAIQIVSLLFIGHYTDATTLAAVSLGTSYYFMIGYGLVDGLATANYVLTGHPFGAGRHKELGISLQRCLAVGYAACVPIIGFYAASPYIFSRLPDQQVAQGAAKYLRVCVLAVVSQTTFSTFNRWLNVQCIVLPGMVVTGVTACLSPLFFYVLVARCVFRDRAFGAGEGGAAALEREDLGIGVACQPSSRTLFDSPRTLCHTFDPQAADGRGGSCTGLESVHRLQCADDRRLHDLAGERPARDAPAALDWLFGAGVPAVGSLFQVRCAC